MCFVAALSTTVAKATPLPRWAFRARFHPFVARIPLVHTRDVAMCVCVCVRWNDTRRRKCDAEDSSWEEVEEIVFQDWRIFILVFILKVLSMRNNFFHEGNFLRYNFWEIILVLLKFFGIQENFMCLCENEDF